MSHSISAPSNSHVAQATAAFARNSWKLRTADELSDALELIDNRKLSEAIDGMVLGIDRYPSNSTLLSDALTSPLRARHGAAKRGS
jgi:hypothetical protein